MSEVSVKDYVLLAGVYDNRDDASADLKELNALAASGELKQLSAAVISKDAEGKLSVHQATSEGKDAAAAGLVVGAVPAIVLAAVFPPAGLALLGMGAVLGASYAGVLGAVGHFRGGFSREVINEVSGMLDAGQSALVAVAVDSQASKMDTHLARAVTKIASDLDKDDIQAALSELSKP